MDIKMMPIRDIKPYQKNPRKNQRAVPEVVKSLVEFGWKQPLVVDSNMVLIVGHTRLLAAKELKMKEVPVLVATDLDEAKVRAYRIMDNRTHDRSEWDVDVLHEELEALFELDEKYDLSFMDFDLKDLGKEDPKTEKESVTEDRKEFLIVIECEDESHQADLYEELKIRELKCKIM